MDIVAWRWRAIYVSQVAHALWLDMSGRVPWHLEDWSDLELGYLLSSKVCFSAHRLMPGNQLHYVVYASSSTDATESILSDPRIPLRFMEQEPEQGTRLIAATPSETGQNLSGWFHDYVWHAPDDFAYWEFLRANPLLEDRLRRHDVPPYGNVYIVSGCSSASALFADLMRSVNVPILKVRNNLLSVDGEASNHSGMEFDWQGGRGRYLLHTDDIYTGSYFNDPTPPPVGANRGVALWDHVWLDPTKFGQAFSYVSGPDLLGVATWDQKRKYNDLGDWLVSSAQAIRGARFQSGRAGVVEFLQRERDLSEAEAEVCWQALEASVLAYGNGDMKLGYQRLLDGPDSRHEQWCSRTGKC